MLLGLVPAVRTPALCWRHLFAPFLLMISMVGEVSFGSSRPYSPPIFFSLNLMITTITWAVEFRWRSILGIFLVNSFAELSQKARCPTMDFAVKGVIIFAYVKCTTFM